MAKLLMVGVRCLACSTKVVQLEDGEYEHFHKAYDTHRPMLHNYCWFWGDAIGYVARNRDHFFGIAEK